MFFEISSLEFSNQFRANIYVANIKIILIIISNKTS